MTSHMTGLNRKRSGAVKYVQVPNRTVRDVMDRLEHSNPFIDVEEAGSSGQKRKAGESNKDAGPIVLRSLKPNNRESGTSPQDEQNCCGCLRTFAIALAN